MELVTRLHFHLTEKFTHGDLIFLDNLVKMTLMFDGVQLSLPILKTLKSLILLLELDIVSQLTNAIKSTVGELQQISKLEFTLSHRFSQVKKQNNF